MRETTKVEPAVGTAPSDAIDVARVAELRRYLMRPGGAPALQKLFTDHLIAGQRQAGMLIGPIYEDLDDPDRFVWWRAFADMEARRKALETFYYGPMWAAHRDGANATMIDSDDVLLLRPLGRLGAETGVGRPFPRPRVGMSTALVALHDRSADPQARPPADILALVESILPAPILTWSTESATNTFPALPVRVGSAFVLTADFSDTNEMTAALDRLRGDADWSDWLGTYVGDVELMRLQAVIPGEEL
ncbi:putative quinol monooxygenase [Micromonospora sp. NPDC000663]|uniref:putative quinol monooxygenase n=1 Tax=Micromonospora sp. NPDC000663 TaxID=3364218 RepID=UPI003680F414